MEYFYLRSCLEILGAPQARVRTWCPLGFSDLIDSSMTNKLQDAFEKASIAAALLVVVDNTLGPADEADEAAWDALVGSARSHALLEKMVKKAQKAVERGDVSNFDPGNMAQ